MRELLMVGVGGFVGSALRYKVHTLFTTNLSGAQFPWSTFTVNILGCFLVGLLGALFERSEISNPQMRLLLVTGLLGGFTTFSAFGLETMILIRSGNPLFAIINVAASLVVGLLAVWAGLRLGGA